MRRSRIVRSQGDRRSMRARASVDCGWSMDGVSPTTTAQWDDIAAAGAHTRGMLKGIVRLAIFGFVATMIAGVVGAVLARRRATPPPDPAADEISIVVAFD